MENKQKNLTCSTSNHPSPEGQLYLNKTKAIFFITNIHSIQGLRAAQGRRLLNDVLDMDVKIGSENYDDMENRYRLTFPLGRLSL